MKPDRGAGGGQRAVIDIGSNTVRLVVYDGPARAPDVVWNEKVAARLGRELQTSGLIPEEAADDALSALARYRLLLTDRGVTKVQTVATAASRDAANGAAFLAEVAALGLDPCLLSGEEEAIAAALGVIGAFPAADGVAVDLGGGSLELVRIAGGQTGQPASLAFGTLRLPRLREQGKFGRIFDEAFDSAGWTVDGGAPLYMIGGTWRAFADLAMREAGYPLTDPHGFRLPAQAAARLAKRLAQMKPRDLETLGTISPMRAATLPDAAALLRRLIERLHPEELVFSSWGLREGLLFADLTTEERQADPLLAGVESFVGARQRSTPDAARLAEWTGALAGASGPQADRTRLAAAHLSSALQRVEPNLRARYAEEWSLDKRWISLEPEGRAVICAALYGSLGKTEPPGRLVRLAEMSALREGITWGLGFRLARRLGAGATAALDHSRLCIDERRLILELDQSRAALMTSAVHKDLNALAAWIGREPQVLTTTLTPQALDAAR